MSSKDFFPVIDSNRYLISGELISETIFFSVKASLILLLAGTSAKSESMLSTLVAASITGILASTRESKSFGIFSLRTLSAS